MTSRFLRLVLAGSLITVVLSLGAPVAAAASDLPASAGAPSFWALAWQWLTERIPLAAAEEEGAVPPPPVVEAERSDAGWILDPNG